MLEIVAFVRSLNDAIDKFVIRLELFRLSSDKPNNLLCKELVHAHLRCDNVSFKLEFSSEHCKLDVSMCINQNDRT